MREKGEGAAVGVLAEAGISHAVDVCADKKAFKSYLDIINDS